MEITFGSATRLARVSLKIKVEDYITGLGSCVSKSYVNQIELHDEIPNKELVQKIAKVLDLDENELIELAKQGKRKQFENWHQCHQWNISLSSLEYIIGITGIYH